MPNSPWPALPFLVSYLLPPLVLVCVFQHGAWTFLPVALFVTLLPALDALSGVAGQWRQAPVLGFNKWFRAITWGWVPLQVVLLFLVLRTVRAGRLSVSDMIGAAAALGITAGAIGVTVAQELVHRRHAAERALAHVLLAAVSYPHFALSHVHWHHRWVGTPHDPSTARLGESFYAFLPRAIGGGLRTAWQIEQERLRSRGKHALSLSNRLVHFAAIQIVIYAGLLVWTGRSGVAVFAAQSLAAIVVVEAFNYIGHYGLSRARLAPGEYERVAAHHSWDSAYRLSNWMLFYLPRRADHHITSSKRFQSLELLPHSPRLPAGYGSMCLLALVPPLWFSVMDRRVAKARTVDGRR